jgi:hypothetical protein
VRNQRSVEEQPRNYQTKPTKGLFSALLWGKKGHRMTEVSLADIAMADAAIACWEAKYRYVFWRPVTAIPLADCDGTGPPDG